jgi:hypothetical protein
MGARRVGVTSLPPLGCLPAAITLFGHGSNGCVSRLNADAQSFNRKMNATVDSLSRRYPDLKIAVFDIYTPLYDLATSPASQGTMRATERGGSYVYCKFVFAYWFLLNCVARVRLHGGKAGLLRDGHGGDDDLPLQPQVHRDVPERGHVRVLGRRSPVRSGQPSDRRFAYHPGLDPGFIDHHLPGSAFCARTVVYIVVYSIHESNYKRPERK